MSPTDRKLSMAATAVMFRGLVLAPERGGPRTRCRGGALVPRVGHGFADLLSSVERRRGEVGAAIEQRELGGHPQGEPERCAIVDLLAERDGLGDVSRRGVEVTGFEAEATRQW